ncbi:MAG: hypothetical protein JW734_06530 [Candidatus Omnitrophica bacterium]|nr:hypothetical protein [Candidatus Omnitrophota bacterium]
MNAERPILDENARVAAIMKEMYPGQEKLAEKLIVSGASIEEARRTFDENTSLELRCKRLWENDSEIRQLFPKLEDYISHKRNKENQEYMDGTPVDASIV